MKNDRPEDEHEVPENVKEIRASAPKPKQLRRRPSFEEVYEVISGYVFLKDG